METSGKEGSMTASYNKALDFVRVHVLPWEYWYGVRILTPSLPWYRDNICTVSWVGISDGRDLSQDAGFR